ncbi:hypothetical protein IMX07_02740 [bacterium]|nr:hypothetical protein [bacterium]
MLYLPELTAHTLRLKDSNLYRDLQTLEALAAPEAMPVALIPENALKNEKRVTINRKRRA